MSRHRVTRLGTPVGVRSRFPGQTSKTPLPCGCGHTASLDRSFRERTPQRCTLPSTGRVPSFFWEHHLHQDQHLPEHPHLELFLGNQTPIKGQMPQRVDREHPPETWGTGKAATLGRGNFDHRNRRGHRRHPHSSCFHPLPAPTPTPECTPTPTITLPPFLGYRISVVTGDVTDAGTDAHVSIKLDNPNRNDFERGKTDTFTPLRSRTWGSSTGDTPP